jgi:uncharacterized membrane protein YkvA (DUF1232 family)
MKLVVILIAAIYVISPIDLAPGFLDDLVVLFLSSGYLVSKKES